MCAIVPGVFLGIMIIPAAVAQGLQARVTAGSTIFADEGAVYEATVGGAVRVYLSRRWSVEPEFLHARTDGDRNHFFWGNIAFDILPRDSRIVPYWHAGPGFVRHTTRAGRVRFTAQEAAAGFGSGVRFRISDRVFVAPQFRTGIADGVFVEFTGSIGYIWKR